MSSDSSPLEYPLPTLALNRRTHLLEGIDGIRVSVPWALDHVNCWLLEEPGVPDSAGTLVDTGIKNSATRDFWQDTFSELSPHRLLVTHYHPDHAGLAGWFHERGCSCYSHRFEIALMHDLWATDSEAYVQEFSNWYLRHGLDEPHIRTVRKIGQGYRATVVEPPEPSLWEMLSAGDKIQLGSRLFEVMTGHGHAPAMLMFFCRAENLLIAADQVLPKISPNISLYPGTADQNPLGSFLGSLDKLLCLPENTLVLPSHGDPFMGLHQRVYALQEHHEEQLNKLRKNCTAPVQASDVLTTLFSRKLDAQQMTFALGEAIAHLRFLASTGELVEQQESGKTFFSPT